MRHSTLTTAGILGCGVSDWSAMISRRGQRRERDRGKEKKGSRGGLRFAWLASGHTGAVVQNKKSCTANNNRRGWLQCDAVFFLGVDNNMSC